jgi:hypothetical protein
MTLEEQLIEQKRLSELCADDNEHKLQYSNPYSREVQRLQSLVDFESLGVYVVPHTDGTVLVEDKYVFSLRSYKWKAKSKGTWYRSRGVKDFVTNIIRKSK